MPPSPSPERHLTELAAESWEALFRAQSALLRRFAADDVWDPISLREYDVLFTLSRTPDHRARLRDLNREVLLSQPSLSRMVERLSEAGLVRRESDRSDGRGTVVVLTDAGLAMQRSVGRRHAAGIRRYVGQALDDEELLALQRLCDKLRLAQESIPD
ncbi:MarR family winged helix-turn-helix transcriptional regulator [Umezawaea sp. Da 62-37]|uniref:MarR family winged helix-turn-helix transcriptional regulator n=1 Tax=Umezawaea sp. Da 62-37 TaxID=3075927 RepID=UPI0028F6F3B4|nr:MarR family winged helix-turn-helix transcriptional regulator [Umezawaea sp. Da 62-37]WNV84472.1 MarR family winged helix-turn-helix transcriptional regulator [Umezawaea sp. Da 62-37]